MGPMGYPAADTEEDPMGCPAADIEDPMDLSVAIEGPRGSAGDIEDPMDSAAGWHTEVAAVAEAEAGHHIHLTEAAYMMGQVHRHRTI